MNYFKQFFLLLTTTLVAQPMRAAAPTLDKLPEPAPILRSKSSPGGYPTAPFKRRAFKLFLQTPLTHEVPSTSSSPRSKSSTSTSTIDSVGVDSFTPKQQRVSLFHHLLSASNTPRSASDKSAGDSGTDVSESPMVQSPVHLLMVPNQLLDPRSKAGFQSPPPLKAFRFNKKVVTAFFSSKAQQQE